MNSEYVSAIRLRAPELLILSLCFCEYFFRSLPYPLPNHLATMRQPIHSSVIIVVQLVFFLCSGTITDFFDICRKVSSSTTVPWSCKYRQEVASTLYLKENIMDSISGAGSRQQTLQILLHFRFNDWRNVCNATHIHTFSISLTCQHQLCLRQLTV